MQLTKIEKNGSRLKVKVATKRRVVIFSVRRLICVCVGGVFVKKEIIIVRCQPNFKFQVVFFRCGKLHKGSFATKIHEQHGRVLRGAWLYL